MDYNMTELKVFHLSASPEVFREGLAAFRNTREWAAAQRTKLVSGAKSDAQDPKLQRTELTSAVKDETQHPGLQRTELTSAMKNATQHSGPRRVLLLQRWHDFLTKVYNDPAIVSKLHSLLIAMLVLNALVGLLLKLRKESESFRLVQTTANS